MEKSAFVSLAPQLKEEKGHDYPYHSAVKQAVESRGGTFLAFVHREFCIDSASNQWIPWFQKQLNPKTLRGKLQALFRMFLDCVKLFRSPSASSTPKIYFLESFCTSDLLSLSLAVFLTFKKRDSLWILFRFDVVEDRLRKTLQRGCIGLLKKKLKQRLSLLTDSELLAASYQTIFRSPLSVMPIPHTEIPPRRKLEKKEKTIWLWPGVPRPEKGIRQIQTLLEIKDPGAACCELRLGNAKTLIPKNALSLHFLEHTLRREQYWEEFSQADFVLLPYAPKNYSRRTSGIFVESIVADKIPLVKGGTWLAYELKRFHLEELIVDWDDPLFFTHHSGKARNPDVLQKLETMRRAYQAFHSIGNYSEQIQKLRNLQTD